MTIHDAEAVLNNFPSFSSINKIRGATITERSWILSASLA